MFRTLRALAWAVALATAAHHAPKALAQASEPVTFRMLVVSSEDVARRLAGQAAGGSDFGALARAESIDPSAERGGLIGPVELSALRGELREALAALAPGQTSAVIRVPTGFAVLQRVEPEARRLIGSREIAAVAAVGSVRYTVSVDGFSEANAALETLPKPAGWNEDPRLICELREQSLAQVKTALSGLLQPDATARRAEFTPLEVIQAHVALGNLNAFEGRMQQVLDEYRRAYALAEKEVPEALPDLLQMLGVAHLHKAHVDNGTFHAPADRCLISPRPVSRLANTADAERAIEHFTKSLAQRPDDLEMRWLLNLAYMATGGYPGRVPAEHVVPPPVFESAEDVGRFLDVAAEAGVSSFSSAGGVVVDDFDNDGQLEILTSNFDRCGQLQLFRRGTDGRFGDAGARAGLAGQLGGLNLLQADYDNDGCRDVLLLRGGWEQPQRKSLLRNNCDGTFTDVTLASGLSTPVTSTQAASWADYDNDGFVDLFVANEESPAQLFHNRRDGTFEDVAASAGIGRTAFSKGVAAADMDNDGDVDFYVANIGGGNFFYRNDGNGTFTERAAAAGVPGPEHGFPTWFFDYDNDGWEDLFVSSYYLSLDESVRSYLGRPQNAPTMKLYRNNRDGTFTDATVSAGLAKVYMPMGANFGDIDNDGYLDVYLGTGSPSYAALVPSVLLRNRGGASFVDVTASSGTGELHKGHGVAFADLDADGDQEIVFKVGGATPGDAHAFRLFDNPGHGGDWLGVSLVGVKTNRAAIGARITVTVESGGVRRAIHRTVNSGGSFGASPLQQHIGLGRNARVVDLRIWWPTSNTRQRFAGVGKNQVIEVRELADRYVTLDRPVRPLGGSARAR
jgi:tetratricopeptide (TPR) repeat protein